MPIGFKRPIEVIFHLADTSAEAYSASAFDEDGVTWTHHTVPDAQFTPGIAKRYDLQLQGYRFLGECSVKVPTKYEGLVNSGSYLTIGSVDWNYARMSEMGVGFGNDRIVLALTRRADTEG